MSRSRFSLALAIAVLTVACSTAPGPVVAPPPPPPVDPVAVQDAQAPRAEESTASSLQLQAAPASVHHKRAAGMGVPMLESYCCAPAQAQDRERYAQITSNRVQAVAEQPVSTLSIDVDTGSYANVRRFLREGRLPPTDAVRVEELINYFDYADAAPREPGTPFSIHTEMAPAPWNARTQLLRIGIQGYKPQGKAPASNLVFLVDVSGSMNESAKLPLVKSSLKLLTRQLGPDDRISLVVYAGSSGVVLEPTPGNQGARISAALDRLEAGGSTHGSEGILAAYALAQQAFIPGGNNRVLLATDGDFNVGVTRFESLLDLVKERRRSGIALTTLGFGSGNYNDQLMEQLADAGDGNYSYVDTLAEAQKVLVEQREATLMTIARDVKIQVEFNPASVAEYRLIGYENRLLNREDFNNDQVDAGDIGAGHSVTALYEIALVGSSGERLEPLRYGSAQARAPVAELAHVRLRYQRPQDGTSAHSRLIERPVLRSASAGSEPSQAWRLSAAVAAFGQLLRGGQYTEGFRYTDVERLASAARGEDRHGYAGEFLQLVKLAQGLSTQQVNVREVQD